MTRPVGPPAHRDALRATLLENGALLVRGLGLRDAAAVVRSSAGWPAPA